MLWTWLQVNGPASGVDLTPGLQAAEQSLTATMTSAFPFIMKLMMIVIGVTVIMTVLRKVSSGGGS